MPSSLVSNIQTAVQTLPESIDIAYYLDPQNICTLYKNICCSVNIMNRQLICDIEAWNVHDPQRAILDM